MPTTLLDFESAGVLPWWFLWGAKGYFSVWTLPTEESVQVCVLHSPEALVAVKEKSSLSRSTDLWTALPFPLLRLAANGWDRLKLCIPCSLLLFVSHFRNSELWETVCLLKSPSPARRVQADLMVRLVTGGLQAWLVLAALQEISFEKKNI